MQHLNKSGTKGDGTWYLVQFDEQKRNTEVAATPFTKVTDTQYTCNQGIACDGDSGYEANPNLADNRRLKRWLKQY